jgi:two-component system nitrate/nitrite response regulator NarL
MVAKQDFSAPATASTPRAASDVVSASTSMGEKTIWVIVKGRLFRDGILSVLSAPDRNVVGNFESLTEASTALPAPDLIVVGAGGDGDADAIFSEIRRLHEGLPTSKWLLLNRRTDPEFIQKACESGVDWLLPEDSPAEVLQLLTRLILVGHFSAPTQLVRVVINEPDVHEQKPPPENSLSLHDQPKAEGPAPTAPAALVHRVAHEQPVLFGRAVPRTGTDIMENRNTAEGAGLTRRQIELSDRENEILGCLVSGLSNKNIARKLNIAEATVKVHVKGLLRKMQVSNRTQAAVLALNTLGDRSEHPQHTDGDVS